MVSIIFVASKNLFFFKLFDSRLTFALKFSLNKIPLLIISKKIEFGLINLNKSIYSKSKSKVKLKGFNKTFPS